MRKYNGNNVCECTYGMCFHSDECQNFAEQEHGDQYFCKPCVNQLLRDGILQLEEEVN